ncbi:MAG TPA: nucleotidyltransferase domain-containing protein [Chitinophagaceae bacterium]
MPQQQFAQNVVKKIKTDPQVIALAVGGSWLTNELDKYSDLDLVLVTEEKISNDKEKMLNYARSFGNFLSGFTGEHVGEPRVLICLYDTPLLHVDIKFLTLEEVGTRIETPVILHDTRGQLQNALNNSRAVFPYPDYQWIEDRFWIWIHYAVLKIGRGEYFEAIDGLSFLRQVVLGPLYHIKNRLLPRGVRKMEMQLPVADIDALKKTVAGYDRESLFNALENSMAIYEKLRSDLFDKKVRLQKATEHKVKQYLVEIKQKV